MHKLNKFILNGKNLPGLAVFLFLLEKIFSDQKGLNLDLWSGFLFDLNSWFASKYGQKQEENKVLATNIIEEHYLPCHWYIYFIIELLLKIKYWWLMKKNLSKIFRYGN